MRVPKVQLFHILSQEKRYIYPSLWSRAPFLFYIREQGKRCRLLVSAANLSGGLLEVGDEVLALALLLETGEDHLGALDVLGRVDEVLHESILAPVDASGLVGGRVGKVRDGTGGTAEETVQVGALLVALTLTDSVALRALGLEDLGTLGGVTHFV
jgi:hypothetical protein